LNQRIGKFAPLTRVRSVKRETVDARDTITVIVETAKRIFLWRVVVDENGKIVEMILDEEE
jgi:hypothetical protein